ncbi:MAG: hypothetical protein LC624_11210 [Halobacteriales archaeon]|nr:hypothetical protein [Halobacteriales archaeon]
MRRLAWALVLGALGVGIGELVLAFRCGGRCGDIGLDAFAPIVAALVGVAGLGIRKPQVALVAGVLALPLGALFVDPLLLGEGGLLVVGGLTALPDAPTPAP